MECSVPAPAIAAMVRRERTRTCKDGADLPDRGGSSRCKTDPWVGGSGPRRAGPRIRWRSAVLWRPPCARSGVPAQVDPWRIRRASRPDRSRALGLRAHRPHGGALPGRRPCGPGACGSRALLLPPALESAPATDLRDRRLFGLRQRRVGRVLRGARRGVLVRGYCGRAKPGGPTAGAMRGRPGTSVSRPPDVPGRSRGWCPLDSAALALGLRLGLPLRRGSPGRPRNPARCRKVVGCGASEVSRNCVGAAAQRPSRRGDPVARSGDADQGGRGDPAERGGLTRAST
jgi:hypothetical protein